MASLMIAPAIAWGRPNPCADDICPPPPPRIEIDHSDIGTGVVNTRRRTTIPTRQPAQMPPTSSSVLIRGLSNATARHVEFKVTVRLGQSTLTADAARSLPNLAKASAAPNAA